MTWYNANGDPAPTSVRIERDGKQVWLMNPSADAEWREANGYTYDTKPIQPPPPPEPRTIFTKLEIRRAMRSLGIEGKLNALLEGSPTFAADWQDAQEINLEDPVLIEALAAGSITQEEIEAIRHAIDEVEDAGDNAD